MRVLAVGGCGFIGTHLCDELVEHGYEVRVLDGLSAQVHGRSGNPPVWLNPKVEFINAFTTDEGLTRKALEGVDAVIHLGALVGVGQSMYDIADYTYFNTHGTAVLLEAMMGRPTIKKLIVASSMSVYGEGRRLVPDNFIGHYADSPADEGWEKAEPIATPENKEPDLQSIYALTKYDQERMCLLWGRAYDVPTIALRFFNVYGTRQSLSNPYTGVIAIFASRLLNNHPPIIFEDGQQRRDFVHVSDVVKGIRLALESDVADEVINLGSGTSHTVLQVAGKLSTLLGKDILPVITGQHRTGDIRHCFADISKAEELLGYQPAMTFDKGIAELIPWLKEQVAVDRLDEHVGELEQRGLLK